MRQDFFVSYYTCTAHLVRLPGTRWKTGKVSEQNSSYSKQITYSGWCDMCSAGLCAELVQVWTLQAEVGASSATIERLSLPQVPGVTAILRMMLQVGVWLGRVLAKV